MRGLEGVVWLAVGVGCRHRAAARGVVVAVSLRVVRNFRESTGGARCFSGCVGVLGALAGVGVPVMCV